MPVQLTQLGYITWSVLSLYKRRALVFAILTQGSAGEVTWKEFMPYYPLFPVYMRKADM